MKIIFAEQLVTLRKARGLSQDELAEKMFMTRQAISTWEKGDVKPDLGKIEKLAAVLDVPVEELLFGAMAEDESFLHRKLNQILTEDESERDWHENHCWREWHYGRINNGWEFLARYWWILFALLGMLGWFIPKMIHAGQ